MAIEMSDGAGGGRTDRKRARLALARVEREVTCLERDCGELPLEELLARLAAARRGLVDAGALLLRHEFVMAVCNGDQEPGDLLRILEDLRRLPGRSFAVRCAGRSPVSRAASRPAGTTTAPRPRDTDVRKPRLPG